MEAQSETRWSGPCPSLCYQVCLSGLLETDSDQVRSPQLSRRSAGRPPTSCFVQKERKMFCLRLCSCAVCACVCCCRFGDFPLSASCRPVLLLRYISEEVLRQSIHFLGINPRRNQCTSWTEKSARLFLLAACPVGRVWSGRVVVMHIYSAKQILCAKYTIIIQQQ